MEKKYDRKPDDIKPNDQAASGIHASNLAFTSQISKDEILAFLAELTDEGRHELLEAAQKQAEKECVAGIRALLEPLELKLSDGVVGFSARKQNESWEISLVRRGRATVAKTSGTTRAAREKHQGVASEGTCMKDATRGSVRFLVDDTQVYERRNERGQTRYYPTEKGIRVLRLRPEHALRPDTTNRIGAVCGVIAYKGREITDAQRNVAKHILDHWCTREEHAGTQESASPDPKVADKGDKRVANVLRLRRKYLDQPDT